MSNDMILSALDWDAVALVFCDWMIPMFWQVTVLIAVLYVLCWCLRKQSSARFRYGLWLMVPVRLVIPPTLALMVGWGWWCLPSAPVQQKATVAQTASQAPKRERVAQVNSLNELPVPTLPVMGVEESTTLQNTATSTDRSLVESSHAKIAATDRTDQPSTQPASLEGNFRQGIGWRFSNWRLAVLFIWSVGACWIFFRLVLGLVRVRSLVAQARQSGKHVNQIAAKCLKLVGLKRTVKVLESSDVATPMLVGILRPVILLPNDCERHLDTKELESVIVHELQHVSRRDPLVHFVDSVLMAIYWFHPGIWFARRQLGRLRELACDEATIATLSSSRKSYASGLIKVAELVTKKRPVPSVGFIERRSQLTDRVIKILDGNTPVGQRISLSGMLAIMLIGMVVIPSAARPPSNQLSAVTTNDNDAPQSSMIDRVDDRRADEEIIASRPYEPLVEVSGVVLNAKDEPDPNATVTVRFWERFRTFKTDEKGNFRFTVPIEATRNLFVLAANQNRSEQASVRLGFEPKPGDYKSIKLKLGPTHKFSVVVKDQTGSAVAGAKVGCVNNYSLVTAGLTDEEGRTELQIPAGLDVDIVFAISKSMGMDYVCFGDPQNRKAKGKTKRAAQPKEVVELRFAPTKPLVIKTKSQVIRPVKDIDICPISLRKPNQPNSLNLSFFPEWFRDQTNEDGVAEFQWIPDWPHSFSFYQSSQKYSANMVEVEQGSVKAKYEMRLVNKFPVKGRASHQDGRPAVGLPIRFHGNGPIVGRAIDTFDSAQVYTNKDGKFKIWVAPHKAFLGFSLHEKLKFAEPVVFSVGDSYEGDDLELKVRPGTRIHGSVKIAMSGRKLKGHSVSIFHYAHAGISIPGSQEPFKGMPKSWKNAITDENGNYEFICGAGSYSIQGSNQRDFEQVKIGDQKEYEFNIALDRPETGMFSGRVVDAASGKAMVGAEVHGVYANPKARKGRFLAKTDSNGRFSVERELVKTVVRVRSIDGKLASVLSLDPDDQSMDFKLKPTVTAKGRLVDIKGNPLSDKTIKFYRRVGLDRGSFTSPFGGMEPIDEKGEFTLPQLVPGVEYDIAVVTEMEGGMAMSWIHVSKLKPKADDSVFQMGDVRFISGRAKRKKKM